MCLGRSEGPPRDASPTHAEAGAQLGDEPPQQGGPWCPRESAAVHGLTQMVRQLPLTHGRTPDISSASGRAAMSSLLRGLQEVSHELGLELARRDYSAALAEHHRACWTQPGCFYSLPVLTTCFQFPGSGQRNNEVVVNGHLFELSRHAARLSSRLRRNWSDVFWQLKQLRKRPVEDWEAVQKATLCEALGALDHAWAAFEERFFAELSFFEMQAQALASRGADLVRSFRRSAAARGGGVGSPASAGGTAPEAAGGHQSNLSLQLFDYVSQMNLALNPRCTGRVFGAEVLMAADMVIASGQAQGLHQQGAISDPACLFASCAIEAFDKLCDHILEDSVSVNSGQESNAGLIERLVAWEFSWELAATYVVDESGRYALRALVDCLRKAQAVSPDLAAICDDRDPELFLVLPRIAWLCFLERPPESAPLLTPLLPQRVGEDLQALQRELRGARAALAVASARAEGTRAYTAQSVGQDRALVNAAVVGAGGDFADLGLPEHTEEALRSFMRTVERWSTELQRHRAGDWNRLCAVILWCLDPRR